MPFVTHGLRVCPLQSFSCCYSSLRQEIERKREIEEALIHRKKSSRLAIRESEREEARLAAKMRQEEEEKMSRARRLEARQQKEEAERLRREKAREQRREEREAREASRKALTTGYVHPSISMTKLFKFLSRRSLEPQSQSPPAEVKSDLPKTQAKHSSGTEKRAPRASAKPRPQSGTRTPAGEDWELACEICHRRGINIVSSFRFLDLHNTDLQ